MTAQLVVGVTLPLTGFLSTQGHQVRRGLELWRHGAEVDQRRAIRLHIVDDGSSARRARRSAEVLLDEPVDLLFGPYGGAAGRAVGKLTGRPGVLIWNHSSSDDDVARPFMVTLPTAASNYLVGAVDLAAERGCSDALIAANDTRFARAVARGAERRAAERGMRVSMLFVEPGRWASRRPHIVSQAASGQLIALCGGLHDDIETVAKLKGLGECQPIIAAVGAGVGYFGRTLGGRAEGVIGPSQWEPEEDPVDVGPTSLQMASAYREFHGSTPDYLAIQAWACGALAEAALDQVGTDVDALWNWALSFDGRTAYGDFRLDSRGRQTGHRMRLVQWDANGNRKLLK